MNPQEVLAEAVEQLRSAWRYRWTALGIAWIAAAAGSLYVFSLPNVFAASARVFVDTNTLLRPLMQGLTAPRDPMDEVQLVSRAVLSRPNLEAVARATDLHLRAGTVAEMEALITSLQGRIVVRGGRDQIFAIEYTDTNREKARDVVAAVLDTFVESALGAQGDDVDVTERALASEMREHEQRLLAAEARLAQFKRENLGYMPSDRGDYFARLQAAINDVTRTEENMRLLAERREELRRQIAGEEPAFGIMPLYDALSDCSRGGQRTQLEEQLSQMLVDFTDRHPRVIALRETIAAIEEHCAAERQMARATGTTLSAAQADPLQTNAVYQNLRVQLSSTEVELAEVRAALRTQQGAVDLLRRDVDKITEVEMQLAQLDRDYNVVESRHQQLLSRWEDLQAKKRLDPVTDNVQFRRIDPPFAHADPVGPNRSLLLMAVFAFALGAGGAAAYGRSQVNPVFFTGRGVHRQVDVALLGTISLLLTPRSIRRMRMTNVLWAAGCLVLLAVAVALIAYSGEVAEVVTGLAPGSQA